MTGTPDPAAPRRRLTMGAVIVGAAASTRTVVAALTLARPAPLTAATVTVCGPSDSAGRSTLVAAAEARRTTVPSTATS